MAPLPSSPTMKAGVYRKSLFRDTSAHDWGVGKRGRAGDVEAGGKSV